MTGIVLFLSLFAIPTSSGAPDSLRMVNVVSFWTSNQWMAGLWEIATNVRVVLHFHVLSLLVQNSKSSLKVYATSTSARATKYYCF